MKSRKSPERITIGELVRALSIGELWAIALAILGLVTGSFGLGYRIDFLLKENRTSETENLVQKLTTKAAFLDRHARYLELSPYWSEAEVAEGGPTYDQYNQQREQTINTYVDLISSWWSEQQPGARIEPNRGELVFEISKGNKRRITGDRVATIRFDYDGSVWEIPEPIKKLVHQRRYAADLARWATDDRDRKTQEGTP